MQHACLIVIDGWGNSSDSPSHKDAIASANIPTMQSLRDHPLHAALEAHGLSVGLPVGLMGNSEVGHLNIGAGRVVYQDIVRIDKAIQKGQLINNEPLDRLLKQCVNGSNRIHLLGLLSDGGVHSHIEHLFALMQEAKRIGITNCFVHCFSDGRDCGQRSFLTYLNELQTFITNNDYGRIGTIIGRYYAMDRDNRMERTQLAFDCLTKGAGESVQDAKTAVEVKYAKNELDEFFQPMLVDKCSVIQPNDTCVFFNFRSDRMRQLTRMLGERCESLTIATMTQYSPEFSFPVLFSPQSLDNVMAEWLSRHAVNQCHVAETEKYAHVTFFFNGGREQPWPGEDRVLIPSPKVVTYDLQPEMSVMQVAATTIEAVESGRYGFVMCNLAPPDMVGHTGNFDAAVKAVEATDRCIQQVWHACRQQGWMLFITADHGNAEVMTDAHGNPHTAHTCSTVPFIALMPDELVQRFSLASTTGALCDVAPSILQCMSLPIPSEMTGRCLFTKE